MTPGGPGRHIDAPSVDIIPDDAEYEGWGTVFKGAEEAWKPNVTGEWIVGTFQGTRDIEVERDGEAVTVSIFLLDCEKSSPPYWAGRMLNLGRPYALVRGLDEVTRGDRIRITTLPAVGMKPGKNDMRNFRVQKAPGT